MMNCYTLVDEHNLQTVLLSGYKSMPSITFLCPAMYIKGIKCWCGSKGVILTPLGLTI